MITPRRPAQKTETILGEMALLAGRLSELNKQTGGFQERRISTTLRHLEAAARELVLARDQFRMLGRRMIEGKTFDQWFEEAGSPDNVSSRDLIELFQEGVDPALVKLNAARLKDALSP